MNNQTPVLDAILYHELRPWVQQQLPETYFTQFQLLPTINTGFVNQFAINFHRPFNYKTKYYSKLINNAINTDIEKMIALINEDKREEWVLYWLNDTLHKRLPTRLKDIANLIREKNWYTITSFTDPTTNNPLAADLSNAYIIQLLKLAYMQIYLTVQGVFKQWVNDILEPNDLYLLYLQEQPPHPSILLPVEPTKKGNQSKPQAVTEQVVQEPAIHSFTYVHLTKQADKLAEFYYQLKQNSFISQQTTLANFKRVFSNKPIAVPITWVGNISELAYCIKLLHNECFLVENVKQKQWEITCRCFVNAHNQPFDRHQLRTVKVPKQTAPLLKTIVKMLQ